MTPDAVWIPTGGKVCWKVQAGDDESICNEQRCNAAEWSEMRTILFFRPAEIDPSDELIHHLIPPGGKIANDSDLPFVI